MNRPLYESPLSLAREAKVAEAIFAHWGYTTKKLSLFYGVDVALIDASRVCVQFAEVKWRDLSFGAGDGYYVTVAKVVSADKLRAVCEVGTMIVARFSDGVARAASFSHVVRGKSFIHGRTDRGDEFDQEPNVVIGWQHFNHNLGPVDEPSEAEIEAARQWLQRGRR